MECAVLSSSIVQREVVLRSLYCVFAMYIMMYIMWCLVNVCHCAFTLGNVVFRPNTVTMMQNKFQRNLTIKIYCIVSYLFNAMRNIHTTVLAMTSFTHYLTHRLSNRELTLAIFDTISRLIDRSLSR